MPGQGRNRGRSPPGAALRPGRAPAEGPGKRTGALRRAHALVGRTRTGRTQRDGARRNDAGEGTAEGRMAMTRPARAPGSGARAVSPRSRAGTGAGGGGAHRNVPRRCGRGGEGLARGAGARAAGLPRRAVPARQGAPCRRLGSSRRFPNHHRNIPESPRLRGRAATANRPVLPARINVAGSAAVAQRSPASTLYAGSGLRLCFSADGHEQWTDSAR